MSVTTYQLESMGQLFTLVEITKFDAIACEISEILFDEFYDGQYYFKYDRYRHHDHATTGLEPTFKLCLNVYVPAINSYNITRLLPVEMDDVDINVEWIDPSREASGFYRKPYDFEPIDSAVSFVSSMKRVPGTGLGTEVN